MGLFGFGKRMEKKKVAFICVHNSCRSQIAEALVNIWQEMSLRVILPEQKQNLRLIRMLSG